MPNKLTINEEAFVKELFKAECNPHLGLTQYQCYCNAYPNQANGDRNTVESNASRLANDNKIITRLNELRKKVEDKLIYSALDSFNELQRLKELALLNTGNNGKADINVAVKAEELRGKLAQLYIEKIHTINENEIDEEQLEKVIKEVEERAIREKAGNKS